MNSSNGVGAFNASVRTNEPQHVAQAAREQRVEDCDAAVAYVEDKLAAIRDGIGSDPTEFEINKLAALQNALAAAEAEATQARAEAQDGRI
jgi:hypothetical protein